MKFGGGNDSKGRIFLAGFAVEDFVGEVVWSVEDEVCGKRAIFAERDIACNLSIGCWKSFWVKDLPTYLGRLGEL